MSPTKETTRIKVMFRGMQNALPGEFRFGDAVFVSDAACDDYDWLVVYDELPNADCGTFRGGREPLRCPRDRTMLLTVEPVSIKRYSTAYTRQFGHLLTNRPFEAERHPGYHFGAGYFKWFYGKPYSEIIGRPPPTKDRLISAVCSSKQMAHTAHHARFTLVKAVSEAIPGCDWFGHGVRPLDNKYEALDPYRYSLAVENHIAPGHWSEKIADALLAECLPFYAGDPGLADTLPGDSFIPIPIDRPHEAVRIIRAAIESNEYEKRLGAIRRARDLLLTKYNFWAQILEVVKECDGIAPPANDGYIASRRRLRRNPLVAISDAWHHLCDGH